MSIEEVTHNVYVSDYSNAMIHGASFDLVLNCTHNMRNVSDKTLRILVADNRDDQDLMYAFWIKHMPHVDTCVGGGGRVLVHCFAGVSRSASTAVAYMLYKDPTKSVVEYVNEVRNRKPDTFMTREMNFKDALESYRLHCLQQQ